MTEEHHDLWADLPEWENEHDPGQVLDWWREAAELFAFLSKLAAASNNEALQTAVFAAENRIAVEVERWDAKVWTILDENIAESRLTPFGEVLVPFLERASLTPYGLLVEAGRIEEPNAEETLLRHMYGPSEAPASTVGGYLSGWEETLSLSIEERKSLTRAHLGESLYRSSP
jgi:hypothetical protein